MVAVGMTEIGDRLLGDEVRLRELVEDLGRMGVSTIGLGMGCRRQGDRG